MKKFIKTVIANKKLKFYFKYFKVIWLTSKLTLFTLTYIFLN